MRSAPARQRASSMQWLLQLTAILKISSDFYLFPKQKIKLRACRFWSNESVMEAVNNFFEYQNREFYIEGWNKLEHRCAKCFEVEGDYI
jgi:hypothetical protein